MIKRTRRQWYSAESGLYQNWHRDYDPTTGRYMQADPLGLVDGASVYGYALQSPDRYVDLEGLSVLLRGFPTESSGDTERECEVAELGDECLEDWEDNKINAHWHDGLDVVSACRKPEIADKTFYYWRKKFYQMGRFQWLEMQAPQKENERLKRIVVDL